MHLVPQAHRPKEDLARSQRQVDAAVGQQDALLPGEQSQPEIRVATIDVSRRYGTRRMDKEPRVSVAAREATHLEGLVVLAAERALHKGWAAGGQRQIKDGWREGSATLVEVAAANRVAKLRQTRRNTVLVRCRRVECAEPCPA